MATAPPAGPPGVATGSFPQWGVATGTDTVTEASSAAAKTAAMNKGYLVWFGSQSAAEQYLTGQVEGDPSVQLPNPLSGIDRVGAVLEAGYKRITDAAMWRSIGWLLFGLALIVMGIRLWLGKSPLPSKPDLPAALPIPV